MTEISHRVIPKLDHEEMTVAGAKSDYTRIAVAQKSMLFEKLAVVIFTFFVKLAV